MAVAISNQTYFPSKAIQKPSLLANFINWAEKEEEKNHVSWVGISVTLTAAVFFPLTVTAILLNGAAFSLIIAAMSAFVLVIIANLAAMQVKYTIPLMVFGVVVDLAIVILSFFVH